MKAFLLKLIRRLHRWIAFRHVLVLGDSHAQIFGHDLLRIYFPFVRFDVCSVGGATVSGLDNPNSKTAAYETFRTRLRGTHQGKPVIVMLGEVDTGFVIWYRAEKHGEMLETMLEKAVSNYCVLIREIANNYTPIVISTPLPTITDDNDWGEVANLRSEVSVSQQKRTQLTLKFNATIKAWCSKQGIAYLALDDESIGENGLVSENLLNNNPQNHHYDPKQHIRLIVPKLRRQLRGIGR